jgi:hypothetical protein
MCSEYDIFDFPVNLKNERKLEDKIVLTIDNAMDRTQDNKQLQKTAEA